MFLYLSCSLLHILYTQLQTLNCVNWIINSNIVPYSYIPHVLLLRILCIQLQTLNFINSIINLIWSLIHVSLIFCYYISCIYTNRLWNILRVLWNVILSNINILPIFYYHLPCIYELTHFAIFVESVHRKTHIIIREQIKINKFKCVVV